MTMQGKKHSEETKRLMSEKSKGNKSFLGRKYNLCERAMNYLLSAN